MTEDMYASLTDAVYHTTLIGVFLFALCHGALCPKDRK